MFLTTLVTVCVCHAELTGYLLTYLLTYHFFNAFGRNKHWTHTIFHSMTLRLVAPWTVSLYTQLVPVNSIMFEFVLVVFDRCALPTSRVACHDVWCRFEAGQWCGSGDHQTQEELVLRHQSSWRLRQLILRHLHRLRRSSSTTPVSYDNLLLRYWQGHQQDQNYTNSLFHCQMLHTLYVPDVTLLCYNNIITLIVWPLFTYNQSC